MINFYHKGSRFLLASFISTILDIVVINLLLVINPITHPLMFTVYKFMGFSVALSNNYFLNSVWVYGKNYLLLNSFKQNIINFFKFLSVNLIALILNLLVATIAFMIIRDYFHELFWQGTISAILGSSAGLVINYFGYQKIFK